MTIARAQMYRQLYQLGGSPVGIATMPMDFGQSLQVNNQGQGQTPLMSQAPNYSSAVNITANPLLNYGQPELNQAGGTPLTMRSGGRIGYQEGGMGMVQDQMQPQQMNAKQALELIIQMLIAQGIPPEQAKEIAIQMVQAVAEGGMQEMSDERVEARFGGRIGYAGGGIGSLVNREGYFLGSVVKGITGAVKGVVKGVTGAVKSIVKSDIGKAALTIAALYASGGGAAFGGPGFSFFGTQAGPGLLGSGGAFDLGSSYLGQGLFGTAGLDTIAGAEGIGSQGLLGKLGITSGYGANLIPGGISSLIPSKGTLTAFLGGTALGGALGGAPRREDFGSDEEYEQAVAKYKAQYQAAINNPNPQFAQGLFPNNPFYPQKTTMAANGGRIGYQEGGIGDLIKQVTQQEFFGKSMMAYGGRMGYALGAEVPMRENQAGVKELDYRDTGGFVPPIGIKERADDIPAMLSNNEFVFTADAVRNAGNGNVNKGAQRMYTLMKNLESGGSV